MIPELCRAMAPSLDPDEEYHLCIMWRGHEGTHICLCGQTFRVSGWAGLAL